MLMRDQIKQAIKKAAAGLGAEANFNFDVSYPDAKFGDYATNAALVLAKQIKLKPAEVAKSLVEKMDQGLFESIEIAGPGFINFRLNSKALTSHPSPLTPHPSGKILLEYFQPNIAKPLHIGHLETAIIGDTIKRQMLYAGYKVESDTHMGDWGTQFGYLILIYKKHGKVDEKLYAELNNAAAEDKSIHEAAKQEFAKLEQGDAENRKIWQGIVSESVQQFLKINDLMDILPFDHHWPESFYEDKMPAVIEELKTKGMLKSSQGAQIVDLEEEKLGVAIMVKSDGSTTYLLRDLATFIFAKQQGFARHLYVVDNRQSHHYRQLFAILKRLGRMEEGEGVHIDYGFISFKGEALSTRKGNMVLALDVISQAEDKVAAIIEEKNPGLKDKHAAVKAIAKGALKYFILKHNRHSDIEFDWEQVLDFEGDSGPYVQYSYARLASILRKSEGGREHQEGTHSRSSSVIPSSSSLRSPISLTERELLFKLSILPEVVEDALKDFLPNVVANYLYNLAGLINKFYHESPVLAETDEEKKNFRLGLIARAKEVLGQGLDLLGIQALDEM